MIFKLATIKKRKSQLWLVRVHCLANLWSDLRMIFDFEDLRHDIFDISRLYFILGAPAVLHPAWASSGQHSSISKEREEKVVLQIRELSIHRRISSFGKQLMATQSKAAQTQNNNNEIGIQRNIDLKPKFSAEGWRPVKMIQPQDGLCKNFYQEQERVCITRNFSFERKYLRAMWEILCDERHPFKEFSLWKHALCRKEEK